MGGRRRAGAGVPSARGLGQPVEPQRRADTHHLPELRHVVGQPDGADVRARTSCRCRGIADSLGVGGH
jgi:hypothetical protein